MSAFPLLGLVLLVVLALGWRAYRRHEQLERLRTNPAPRQVFVQKLPKGRADAPEREAATLSAESGLILHVGGARHLGQGQVDCGVRIVREPGRTRAKAFAWVASDEDVDITGIRKSAYGELGLGPQSRHPGYELAHALRGPHSPADSTPATGSAGDGLAAAFSTLPRQTRLALGGAGGIALFAVYTAISSLIG